MSSARTVRVMDTEESGMKDDPVATCRACDVPVEMKSLLSHEASCRRARVMAMQRLYEFAFGVCEPDVESMTEEEVKEVMKISLDALSVMEADIKQS